MIQLKIYYIINEVYLAECCSSKYGDWWGNTEGEYAKYGNRKKLLLIGYLN